MNISLVLLFVAYFTLCCSEKTVGDSDLEASQIKNHDSVDAQKKSEPSKNGGDDKDETLIIDSEPTKTDNNKTMSESSEPVIKIIAKNETVTRQEQKKDQNELNEKKSENMDNKPTTAWIVGVVIISISLLVLLIISIAVVKHIHNKRAKFYKVVDTGDEYDETDVLLLD
ncbi:hypothetical protein A3Q56_03743 [Intoshia linei]|uniref:Syndecan/Neurexin domain-containing protein n=1 Tax=Intoshia linei TaxID=1819745 RepID=A0A177B4N1_9BILA|nr:hypothetical protein A3Q56_03743 [Intoshia linei]